MNLAMIEDVKAFFDNNHGKNHVEHICKSETKLKSLVDSKKIIQNVKEIKNLYVSF